MGRSNALELRERYRKVQELIVEGFNGADVARYIAEKTDWDISERQAYNYYKDAFDALAQESDVNRKSYHKLSLQRLERQYKKADQANDYRAASSIVMDQVALLRLDTPNADFDWTQAATDAGINPRELTERMLRLMDDETLEAGLKSNGK